MDAQNTQNTQDGFAALAAKLEQFAGSLEPRTRLAFGKNVASALKGIKSGGFVVILCEGCTASDATLAQEIVREGKDMAALVDARGHEYKQVRPNVATFIKSRKLPAVVCPPKKNEDDVAYSFIVRKNVA